MGIGMCIYPLNVTSIQRFVLHDPKHHCLGMYYIQSVSQFLNNGNLPYGDLIIILSYWTEISKRNLFYQCEMVKKKKKNLFS